MERIDRTTWGWIALLAATLAMLALRDKAG